MFQPGATTSAKKGRNTLTAPNHSWFCIGRVGERVASHQSQASRGKEGLTGESQECQQVLC